MALLNVTLPQSSFIVPGLAFLNERKIAVAGQMRVPSLRRSSPLTVRCSSEIATSDFPPPLEIARSDFPSSFKFGASSSALQTESGPTEGGRGLSTWDHHLGQFPAVKSYTKYKDDVSCLKNMNTNAYRFSISWSRILPTGKKSGGINPEGIKFYNNLINELKRNGIEPFVTLFHFDLPAALEKEYNGFSSHKIVEDFNEYVNICFEAFGDRVKYWSTFNEPQVYFRLGSENATNPYKAAHNLILAHATAVKTYRDKYQTKQNGKIGIALNIHGYLPLTSTPSDFAAKDRAWDFGIGWFLDPLETGDYPFSMKTIVRDRLPQFTDKEKKLVEKSYDFVGINYYTARYVKGLEFSSDTLCTSYEKDKYIKELTDDKDGVPIGPKAEGNDWIYAYPAGLYDVLHNLKLKYGNPSIYITENGYPQKRDPLLSTEEIQQDDARIDYIKGHLISVRRALREKVKVEGYFVWSLTDNMEWGTFYSVGFGLNYVDYCDDFKRIPKNSAIWLRRFLSKRYMVHLPLEPVEDGTKPIMAEPIEDGTKPIMVEPIEDGTKPIMAEPFEAGTKPIM